MNSNGKHSGLSSLLIATDGSVYADVAAECSAWLASRLGARITVLYVIDARRLAGHFIRHISEVLESFPSEGIVERVRDYYRRQGEEALKRAIEIARSQDARTFELRASTSLARLWHDQGGG